MSASLTYFIKKHRVRLGPDLTHIPVVFHPGYDAQGGCRVEDSQTGQDFILTEEGRKSEISTTLFFF